MMNKFFKTGATVLERAGRCLNLDEMGRLTKLAEVYAWYAKLQMEYDDHQAFVERMKKRDEGEDWKDA